MPTVQQNTRAGWLLGVFIDQWRGGKTAVRIKTKIPAPPQKQQHNTATSQLGSYSSSSHRHDGDVLPLYCDVEKKSQPVLYLGFLYRESYFTSQFVYAYVSAPRSQSTFSLPISHPADENLESHSQANSLNWEAVQLCDDPRINSEKLRKHGNQFLRIGMFFKSSLSLFSK